MESYSIRHECLQDIEFKDEQVAIFDGQVTVHAGFRWRSFSMSLHALLVFFGLAPMGVIDKVFLYGQPWTTEHSLLRAVLLQYQSTLPIDRVLIDEIYAQGLIDAKVPFQWLWAGLAGWFGPRKG
ncbi:MAG: hypothetical protein ACI8RT_000969 [Candidatus Azotimanducaceae bacterium]|jgi:hypothetical protein|tara:strand:+ start:8925 stop:9299 length:375 start_codon:yes stop_codon:yes gene_type:complete